MDNKNAKKLLVLMMSMTYFVSYITRINYGAIISEMVEDTGFSETMLSMALTGNFIAYGLGQIVSGFLGDKFSPKKLVSLGLIVTVCMNLLIPVCANPYQMLVVWCINGFAQAFMWPPLVKIMSGSLTSDEYKKSIVKVSWGSSFGTILIYLIAPVFISLAGWKSVFVFSAVCGAIMIFVWNFGMAKLPFVTQNVQPDKLKSDSSKVTKKSFMSVVLVGIMLAIVLQGMLRDGVTTWMPSYIKSTYNLGTEISILTGVVLPVFSIFCFNFTSSIYRKKFSNPMTCAAVLFGCGAVSSLCVALFTGKSVILSVLFSALLTGAMHGVNLMLISMIPPFFEKRGNVSTVSGVLNSCTYVGSAISTYGMAVLNSHYGWGFTVCIWAVIAVCGTLVCLLCIRPWLKQMEILK
ncbi:MAG: MFS transporter [Ruminococcaceae bacterium]|nr:MFS transporter [Oscillospiraceae bacterium]